MNVLKWKIFYHKCFLTKQHQTSTQRVIFISWCCMLIFVKVSNMGLMRCTISKTL